MATACPPWRSIASRFPCAYFALYFPFLPLEHLPYIGPLTAPWNDVFTGVVPWLSNRVFHVLLPFVDPIGSRIDSAYGYARVAFILVAALAVTLAWCIGDRRAPDRVRPGEWLHVWLRYAVANAMLHYGIMKLTLGQFSYLSPEKLVERFGEASPMGLMWTFMGYSTGYKVFTGSAECLAGLLLLFRRTSTLGALLTICVMSNVVVLDLCYDVPIKLYAFHLLVMGGLLVAPEAARLADVLVRRRASEPARLEPHFSHPSATRALAWAKAAYLALLFYAVGASGVTNLQSANAPRSPLYGIYEVESFARDGVEIPPLLTDSTRWRRVTVSGSVTAPAVSIWSMKERRDSFAAIDDAERRTLSLESRSGEKTVWEYSLTGRDIVLRGRAEGAAIEVKLRRVDESSIRLLSRGFHWIAVPGVNQ